MKTNITSKTKVSLDTGINAHMKRAKKLLGVNSRDTLINHTLEKYLEGIDINQSLVNYWTDRPAFDKWLDAINDKINLGNLKIEVMDAMRHSETGAYEAVIFQLISYNGEYTPIESVMSSLPYGVKVIGGRKSGLFLAHKHANETLNNEKCDDKHHLLMFGKLMKMLCDDKSLRDYCYMYPFDINTHNDEEAIIFIKVIYTHLNKVYSILSQVEDNDFLKLYSQEQQEFYNMLRDTSDESGLSICVADDHENVLKVFYPYKENSAWLRLYVDLDENPWQYKCLIAFDGEIGKFTPTYAEYNEKARDPREPFFELGLIDIDGNEMDCCQFVEVDEETNEVVKYFPYAGGNRTIDEVFDTETQTIYQARLDAYDEWINTPYFESLDDALTAYKKLLAVDGLI